MEACLFEDLAPERWFAAWKESGICSIEGAHLFNCVACSDGLQVVRARNKICAGGSRRVRQEGCQSMGASLRRSIVIHFDISREKHAGQKRMHGYRVNTLFLR